MPSPSTELEGVQELPRSPSRDNYSYGCEVTDELVQERDHLHRCECDTHHGVCDECGYKITVGPSGTEYGHARATNRGPDENGVRRDCTHRPLECNSGEPQAWDGYDQDDWNSTTAASEGGRA
ncbi:hypothetical protein [Halorubellus salinus]|uniref:hypothetical protein n=1 Tax=Halorubellus salinus TaxID=755309 RepID=UPI001D087A52|nr:hypothetical protein [Halorubellus salinus]